MPPYSKHSDSNDGRNEINAYEILKAKEIFVLL